MTKGIVALIVLALALTAALLLVKPKPNGGAGSVGSLPPGAPGQIVIIEVPPGATALEWRVEGGGGSGSVVDSRPEGDGGKAR